MKIILWGITGVALFAVAGCGITINTSSSTQPISNPEAVHSEATKTSSRPSPTIMSTPSPKPVTKSTSSMTTSSSQNTSHYSSHNTLSSSTNKDSSPKPKYSHQSSQNTSSPPTPNPTSQTTAGVDGGWTQGIWYPNKSFAPIAFVIPLPNAWGPFVQESNPYRSWGWYWSSSKGMQIAISLLPYSMVQMNHAAPSGSTLLVSGGNSGAWSMIWQYSNGLIDANEMVSMGSQQYGWRRAVGGNETADRIFLINVTLPDSPSDLVTAETILAHWSLQDMQTGATWSGQQPSTGSWLPQWPLNPLQNSNEPAMPYWLKDPGAYQ